VLANNSLFPRKQGIVLSEQGIYRPDREIPLIGLLIGRQRRLRTWRLRTFNAPLAPRMSTSRIACGAEPKLEGETLSGFYYIIGLSLRKSRTIVAVKRASRKMLPFLASTASEEFAIIKIGAA
jgi:hypothetical protein